MHANDSKYIKEVWADNLEEEMAYLRDLVEDYPYLAMVRFFSFSFPFQLDQQHVNDRTLNFQVLLRGLLEPSKRHPIITTRRCDVT